MEVERLFKIGVEYIADYLDHFFSTIRRPKLEFPPPQIQIAADPIVASSNNNESLKARLNSKLLSFLLISIFIGSTLNTNIPRSQRAPAFEAILIIIIVCWLLFSSLAHVICKVFSGRQSLVETLSINLQVLAVIYVLSSLAAFLWGALVERCLPYLSEFKMGASIRDPMKVYFIVQITLGFIYLPWANLRLHKMDFLKLRLMSSRGAFCVALAVAERTLFYVSFLVLAIIIAAVSNTMYHVHRVPLSQPVVRNHIDHSEFNTAPQTETRVIYPTRSKKPRYFKKVNTKEREAIENFGNAPFSASQTTGVDAIQQSQSMLSDANKNLGTNIEPTTVSSGQPAPVSFSRARDDPPFFFDRVKAEEPPSKSGAVPLGRCLL